MFGHLCSEAHAKLLDGKCPWCGQRIRWGKKVPGPRPKASANAAHGSTATDVVVPQKQGKDLIGQVTISAAVAKKGGRLAIPIQRPGIVQTVIVSVPPGIQEGTRLRLRGVGEPGPKGSPAGDLYVTVHIRRRSP